MKKNRPTNVKLIDLFAFAFPVTAISSILHRASGILLFIFVPFCLWLLQLSMTGEGFNQVQQILSGSLAKAIQWLILSLLAYHIIAGVRHLFMDAGIGETEKSGRFSAYLVMFLGVLSAALIGVWIW